MRSKEWRWLGWAGLDRKSAWVSIEWGDRGPNGEIYDVCVKENGGRRDSEKESEIGRVWPTVWKKE